VIAAGIAALSQVLSTWPAAIAPPYVATLVYYPMTTQYPSYRAGLHTQ